MINIQINDKTYKVKEAKTPEEREKGLQGVKELPSDEGMLFYFDPPEEECSFWMKDTPIPDSYTSLRANENSLHLV